MASRPTIKETTLQSETFAGVTYSIQGELVPVLAVEMSTRQPIYFEHHVLLWKTATLEIAVKPIKGTVKRLFCGMQIFVTEAQGHGQIAFSRDGAGQILALHIEQGKSIQVREHQFLAATQYVEYEFERVSGISNMLFGSSGLFIDKFRCIDGDGILWLHGYGNVFEVALEEGEMIDVEPGAWLYKDGAVKMDTNMIGIASGFLSSTNIAMNRFTGPGRVGIQSMYIDGAAPPRGSEKK